MIAIIGRMDTRIVLQRATNTTDGQGSVSKSWAALSAVWAKAEALIATEKTGEKTSGNERVAGMEYKFTIRYQAALSSLSPGDRVQWDNQNFDILSAVPMPEGRPDHIQITARRKA